MSASSAIIHLTSLISLSLQGHNTLSRENWKSGLFFTRPWSCIVLTNHFDEHLLLWLKHIGYNFSACDALLKWLYCNNSVLTGMFKPIPSIFSQSFYGFFQIIIAWFLRTPFRMCQINPQYRSIQIRFQELISIQIAQWATFWINCWNPIFIDRHWSSFPDWMLPKPNPFTMYSSLQITHFVFTFIDNVLLRSD